MSNLAKHLIHNRPIVTFGPLFMNVLVLGHGISVKYITWEFIIPTMLIWAGSLAYNIYEFYQKFNK